MKSLEFMYWLQGFFELCEVQEIPKEKLQVIKNHLEMVKITEGREKLPFCHWIEGFFEGLNDDYLNKDKTNIIKNRLNNIFDHVVDRKLNLSTENNSNLLPHNRLPLDSTTESFLIKC
jgi:hypothetical protein